LQRAAAMHCIFHNRENSASVRLRVNLWSLTTVWSWPTAGMLLKLDGKPERMVLIRGRLVSVSSKVHGKLRISIGAGAVLGVKRQPDDVVAAGPLRFKADINLAQRPITAVFHEGVGYGDRLGLNLVQGGNDSFGLRDCVFVGGIVSSTYIETDAISAFAKPLSRMM
jgi:hypothetical protein